jgi:putative phosphoribosyl transferase
MATRFTDRTQAGAALGESLLKLGLPAPIIVLALPRGGVAVAAEIARMLDAPLDVILVRKIGAPFEPELAMAAVAEGDPPEIVVDEEVRRLAGADAAYIESQARVELLEIARRRQLYRPGAGSPNMAGRTAIVVDDGIATGSTMRAALRAVRRQQPLMLVLAVPVAAADSLRSLRGAADRVVCLSQPSGFRAVGQYYDDFHQLDDAEVLAALRARP